MLGARFECAQRQHGAFDARRHHLAAQFLDQRLVGHLLKLVEGLALHHLGDNGGRRLADRAAFAFERDVGDPLGLVDGGVHVDNVAAAGVTAGVVDVRPFDDAAVTGVLIVVE